MLGTFGASLRNLDNLAPTIHQSMGCGRAGLHGLAPAAPKSHRPCRTARPRPCHTCQCGFHHARAARAESHSRHQKPALARGEAALADGPLLAAPSVVHSSAGRLESPIHRERGPHERATSRLEQTGYRCWLAGRFARPSARLQRIGTRQAAATD